MDRFTWKVENFSLIEEKRHYSEIFIVGGNKWRTYYFYPKGNDRNELSIYLEVPDPATLPQGRSRYVQIRFSIINQISRKNSNVKVTSQEFNAKQPAWGIENFLPVSELHDPSKGYLVNDTCLVEVDVSTDRTVDLLSHEFEPEELTEEEIDTFCTSLESELANYRIHSPEAAKEALAKIELALDMAPANFYATGKCSSLHMAFNVLSNSDCLFSALTMEQQEELLAMEKISKELPQRVAKAMQDKNLLSEKETMNLTLTSDLENSLNFFKEAREELKQIEQKFADLQEQKNNILSARKDKLKTAKKMKLQLEALGKELPEYVAKANAAEEEEKKTAAEWSRMKDFISSVKEIINKGTN